MDDDGRSRCRSLYRALFAVAVGRKPCFSVFLRGNRVDFDPFHACPFGVCLYVARVVGNGELGVSIGGTRDVFDRDLRAMVDSFRLLPSRPDIYLCKPVPSFPNEYNINDSVLMADVVPAIEQVATEQSCKIIDLHTTFVDRMNLFPDGVHPGKEGAVELAEYIASSIKK